MRNEFQACPPRNLAGLMEPETISPAAALTEGAGTRIGRYKLLQLIGEGGFGSVFMAEQETPVVRKVALKIIKLGMDTKQVIARFEAERQALAMMDHPNIARVLDAGATETGRPYFVMELVKGITITDYCDQKHLTLKQRLELFIPVCKAIQHAHQKGIIHRDLKPSNVMVTLHDGVPVPKVIDFGIAKATNARLTEHTLFTEYRQLIGTPEYTSPEQADISGLDVDTRSDIYSLGVLLYQLLTGTTPFESKELRRCAYSEIQRIIREVEPPKPSTRLSTLGASLQTLAQHMDGEPKRLSRLMAGELDWIVMKCLEKDRSRRYETANGLARDIQRYLAAEPVEASPPTAGYKARKFVAKHRLALGIAAGFLLLLLIAVVVSSWQAVRAARAEARTAEERDRVTAEKNRADEQMMIAEAVNDFLNEDVLGQASTANQVYVEKNIAPDRDLKVRDALDRAADRIGIRFQNQPLVEAAIHYSIGDAYGDLGEWNKAQEHLEAALRLRRRLLGEKHPHTQVVVRRLISLYMTGRQWDTAAALGEEELGRLHAVIGESDPEVINLISRLADVYRLLRRYPEAERLATRALELRRRLLGNENPLTVGAMAELGDIYASEDRVDLAEALLLQSIQNYGDDGRGNAHRAIKNLALLYQRRHQYQKAEPLFLQLLKVRREVAGDLDPIMLYDMVDLGLMYREQRRHADAELVLLRALDGQRKVWGERHADTLNTLLCVADLYFQSDEYAKAASQYRALLAQLELGGRLLTGAAPIRSRLLACYRNLGQDQSKESKELSATIKRVFNSWIQEKTEALSSHPSDPELLHQRGCMYAQMGRFSEALGDFSKAVELAPDNHHNWHEGLVPVLVQTGDIDGYRRMRRAELQQFATTTDGAAAHRVSKDALMIPADGEDLKLAVELAERARTGPQAWYSQTMGMSQYRTGHYRDAISWLEKTAAAPEWGYSRTSADLFTAMAYERLGDHKSACQTLSRAVERMEKEFPKAGEDDLGAFQDWILCQAVRREAEALINGKGPTTKPVSSTQPVTLN